MTADAFANALGTFLEYRVVKNMGSNWNRLGYSGLAAFLKTGMGGQFLKKHAAFLFDADGHIDAVSAKSLVASTFKMSGNVKGKVPTLSDFASFMKGYVPAECELSLGPEDAEYFNSLLET